MTTFETKQHIEIDKNYQGINLTKFSFVVDDQIGTEEIVDTFIRTEHFSNDSLRDCQKNVGNGCLGRAFSFDKVKITDFKKTDKVGTSKFLIDFINEPDWGDDRNDFANLLDKYFEILKELGGNHFYIISKD